MTIAEARALRGRDRRMCAPAREARGPIGRAGSNRRPSLGGSKLGRRLPQSDRIVDQVADDLTKRADRIVDQV